MYKIDVARVVDGSIDAIWAVLADFANLDWYAPVEKVEKVGEGIGQIRRVYMANMPEPVEEVLDTVNADAFVLEYHIPATGSNIMLDYSVTAALRLLDSGKVEARWQAQFSGIKDALLPAEQMVEIMDKTYGDMILVLAETAAKRAQ